MLRVASWGCGLQSTTMIAMSALGELEPLDAVIHCDLGWERQATMESRRWYTDWLAYRGVLVLILDVGDIRQLGSTEHIHMPFWTQDGGHLRRQCTRHFKIRPMRQRVRQLLGYDPSVPPAPPPGSVEQWIGISLDEWQRADESRVQYIHNRYPLLQHDMTREDCARWLEEHDLPVPIKSACVGCPFRKASEWLEMRESTPGEWAEAVAFDEQIRHHKLDRVTAGELYVYKHRAPLTEADLEADAAREMQTSAYQIPMAFKWRS